MVQTEAGRKKKKSNFRYVGQLSLMVLLLVAFSANSL